MGLARDGCPHFNALLRHGAATRFGPSFASRLRSRVRLGVVNAGGEGEASVQAAVSRGEWRCWCRQQRRCHQRSNGSRTGEREGGFGVTNVANIERSGRQAALHH